MRVTLTCLAVFVASGCEDSEVDVLDGGFFDDAGEDAGYFDDAGLDAGDAAAGDADVTDAGDAGDAGADGDAGACVEPTSGLYATFEVAGEEFRAHITNEEAIQDAIELWQGVSAASVPNGALVCAAADFNCGYEWHLEPGSIQFSGVTTEVCDGAPSHIEENCDSFVENYCPWGATMIELHECDDTECTPLDPPSATAP